MIRNQRGGIVVFGIVTLVLVGLLAGGLYVSKQQARTARETDTTTPQVSAPAATKKTSEETKKDATPTTPDSQTATTTPQPASTTPASTATTPAATSTTPATPTTTTESTTRVASAGPSAPLPATGPKDVALITVGLGVLGFTIYSLYRSRRDLQRAALRK